MLSQKDEAVEPVKQAIEHHYFHDEEKPHHAEWTYEGETGPTHWGDLSSEYRLAKTGMQQSPIDISSFTTEKASPLRFDYKPAQLNLVYNGHTIQETDDNGSTITVNNRTYQLRQFHFHAPSEHTINGKHFAMEMHLVHKDVNGVVAVVGVLIQEGKTNAAFDPIWNYLPTAENKRLKYEIEVDIDALLPKQRGYFQYKGSFTTPPCTEGVQWILLEKPIELSASQIERFKAIVSGNNRPIQPLNSRKIILKN